MVAVDVLLGRQSDVGRVDAVLSIVDASNLERNLYLLSQVLELGLPTVVAVNMVDIANSKGLDVDMARLGQQLGVPVIAVQANRGIGVGVLKTALARAFRRDRRGGAGEPVSRGVSGRSGRLQSVLPAGAMGDGHAGGGHALPRYLVERLLLDTTGYLEDVVISKAETNGARGQLVAARKRLADAGIGVPAIEAQSRYAWVGRVLDGVVQRPRQRVVTHGDRIDRVLTHKFWGTLVFCLAMLILFSSVFVAADPAMRAIDAVVGRVGDAVAGSIPPGPLESLLVDGVIGGVGSVLVFLPQILILFFSWPFLKTAVTWPGLRT